MKSVNKKALTLKALTKSNVWNIQENDIFRMWEDADKDALVRESSRKYLDILKTAFLIEELGDASTMMKTKYEKMGYKVGKLAVDDGEKRMWAVKKRPIVRVSDLSYENINHISAAKLIEVLDRNFGGGWDSLSQSTKDIIESGFDISTTTLPQNRLHKPGGMFEKKVADGYEVLEVPKGSWVEAIFAKAKPEAEKPKSKYSLDDDIEKDSDIENEDADVEIEDTYNKPDEDDKEIEEPTDFNEEEMTEENYRTTFDITSDPDEEADEIGDYIDEL